MGLKRPAPSASATAAKQEQAAVVDVDTKEDDAAAKRPKKERAQALPEEDEPDFDEDLLVLDWCKFKQAKVFPKVRAQDSDVFSFQTTPI